MNHSFGFTIENTKVLTSDGQKLSAILTLPSSETKVAALILQGSGNVSFDGDVSSPFLGAPYQDGSGKLSEQIAETLAQVGIATLRYSKRGVDDPEQLANQKFPYLKTDAESAYQLLQNRFPQSKKAIIGFSEGSLIASLMASDTPIDGLFLLAPFLRPIDEAFGYQFLSWPVELIQKKVKMDAFQNISESTLSTYSESLLPVIGKPWSIADLNQDRKISMTQELIPTYQGFYSAIRGLLATPAYSGWYQSFGTLPSFPQYAPLIKASQIHVYQGMEDSQVRWNWIVEDLVFFPVKPTLHLFPGVGHCFAPMEGTLGEIKHSGPLSSDLLAQLSSDFQSL